jgi:hypothetical protein
MTDPPTTIDAAARTRNPYNLRPSGVPVFVPIEPLR